MLLKELSIPLCDLRLKMNGNNFPSPHVARGKKLSDTEVKYSPSDEEIGSKKEIQQNEESGEDESYEVKKVKVVKKVVKILSSGSEKEGDENVPRSQKEKSRKMHLRKRNVQKILYKFKFKKGKSDEEPSSEEDNSDDPDFDIKNEEGKKEKETFKNSVQDFIPRHSPKKKVLSAYEEMIQRNREEKMAFLQSIKIAEAKAGLAEYVEKSAKKKPQPVKRKYHTVQRPRSPPVLRKSRRLANQNVDLSEDSLYANALKSALASEEPKKTIPPEITFKEALESEEFYENYAVDFSIQESKSEEKFFSYDKSILSRMTVSESNIAKVTPARITALSWYPSLEQFIVAAADKYGQLGIWNVDSNSNPYVFKIHLEGITNLKFSPYHQEQIVSSSYDGILRCGDMIKHCFNELYNVYDETCCTYFDFLSASTYLVAQKNGQVALVDKRTGGKNCEKKHTCHDYSIKTVNIHPVNKNFFVTAENKGAIRLWDLRKLQRNPVADITYHRRCVQSAFFSPITGNSILATSADDSISIFDSTNLTSDVKLKVQMRHDNQTGRWLSVFRATWLPNTDDIFVVGSMQYPRRIEVFDKNLFTYNLMMHDNLTTITSTNDFHPLRPALAGGNSSGKVFVFT